MTSHLSPLALTLVVTSSSNIDHPNSFHNLLVESLRQALSPLARILKLLLIYSLQMEQAIKMKLESKTATVQLSRCKKMDPSLLTSKLPNKIINLSPLRPLK